MKQITLFAAIAATFCLCIACNRLEMPDNPPVTEDDAPSKYVPYKAEFINVAAGTQSLVYLNNELVATCYKSGYVVLPKASAVKSLEDYQIVSIPYEGASAAASENKLEMVVAFEDSKNGDHDYNDLVFQARLSITNPASGASTVHMDITPVALGASIKLGLGVVLTDSEGNVLADKLITDDCRSDLFAGDGGFINTQQIRKHYGVVPVNVTAAETGAVAGVSWYLVAAGQRLYASNYFQACLDNAKVPQGLVLMNIREDDYYLHQDNKKYYCGTDFWQYPTEWTPIYEVYPGFEQAFIEGGDFSIFANPVGRFFDAIAADSDNCLTNDCLYDVYKADCRVVPDEDDPPLAAELYYDNLGKSYYAPQAIEGAYDTYNHSKDNFIIEFSTAKGNEVDFARGDVIEAKITTCVDYPFVIGALNPDAPGKTVEGYTNGAHSWWRIQDASDNHALESGKTFPAPLVVRISKSGIDFFINGEFEQRLSSSNEALASVLALGTDTPLYFGLFGNYCSTASYEYLKVTRNINPTVIKSVAVSPSTKSIVVGESATLTAAVDPETANQDVTWSSSDTSVATVDPATGEVTGVAAGTCTITATSNSDTSKSGTCSLTVSNVAVSSISVADKSILVDGKATLTATVLPANATVKTVTWSSSDTSVATVNASTGEVTGVAAGTCTITATSVSTPGVSGSCTLTVSVPSQEVILWENLSTSKTALDVKQLEIIASGSPTADQICFNNGDYIEFKYRKKEIAGADKDVIYVGSKSSGHFPYTVIIAHPSKYSELYMVPSYWWSVATVEGIDIDVPMYVRLGCNADGTRGCGSYSTDGVNWVALANKAGNDFEAKWLEMVDPGNSPLLIQSARSTSQLMLSVYDYVKIVRAGATAE